jgi:uncharacterized protein YbjT (DUF2867 family)
MNILVITPDGDIGHQVVADLLSPEFTLRLITDHPAGLPEEWREQMEVISGSADNAGILQRALAGVTSVLWCMPAGSDQEIEQFARALSGAMREAGTSRLVTVSMTGWGLIRSQDIISRQAAIEDILNKSGVMIRHIRYSHLIERRLSQEQSIFEKGTSSWSRSGNIPVPPVEADDVVDVILRCLVRQDWDGIERLAWKSLWKGTTCDKSSPVPKQNRSRTGRGTCELADRRENREKAHAGRRVRNQTRNIG